MNRIDKKFNDLADNNKKALITYITAGDPDIQTTAKLIMEMENNGADIIEIGIPYSDPIAEGPVIQRASSRALKSGTRIKNIMDMVRLTRDKVEVPLVYLVYLNCILQYGVNRFFNECSAVGIDGIIVPDLPYEEKDEISDVADEYGIYIISLISPVSSTRIKKIASHAKGFLYCVSSLGVTGMRNDFDTDFNEFFSIINQYAKIPKALGFGISTPDHIRKLGKYCDGLIVGSSIVKKIEESTSSEQGIINVGEYVKILRRTMDELRTG